MMRKILQEIRMMPYYRNHQAVSGAVHNISSHEDAVKDVLLSHGLKEVDRKISQNERNAWLADPYSCDLAEGTFLFQPCGPNANPDFIIKLDGKAYFLECKSVKGTSKAPMFNSAFPGGPLKGEYIYIFTAEKYNQTTIFFGRDICPPEDYDNWQELVNEHRKLDERYNKRFTNNFGIQHYTRPMVKHVGGTDYFVNEYREQIEQGVLSAV